MNQNSTLLYSVTFIVFNLTSKIQNAFCKSVIIIHYASLISVQPCQCYVFLFFFSLNLPQWQINVSIMFTAYATLLQYYPEFSDSLLYRSFDAMNCTDEASINHLNKKQNFFSRRTSEAIYDFSETSDWALIVVFRFGQWRDILLTPVVLEISCRTMCFRNCGMLENAMDR